jgi:hypothetical protein
MKRLATLLIILSLFIQSSGIAAVYNDTQTGIKSAFAGGSYLYGISYVTKLVQLSIDVTSTAHTHTLTAEKSQNKNDNKKTPSPIGYTRAIKTFSQASYVKNMVSIPPGLQTGTNSFKILFQNQILFIFILISLIPCVLPRGSIDKDIIIMQKYII